MKWFSFRVLFIFAWSLQSLFFYAKTPCQRVWLQCGYNDHLVYGKNNPARAPPLRRINQPVFFPGTLNLPLCGRGIRGNDTQDFICIDHIPKSDIHKLRHLLSPLISRTVNQVPCLHAVITQYSESVPGLFQWMSLILFRYRKQPGHLPWTESCLLPGSFPVR